MLSLSSKCRLLLGVALILLGVSQSVVAQAASSRTLTLSPAGANKTIAAGAVIHDTFTATNKSATTYAYTVSAAPYGVLDENYTPDFRALPGQPNVADWFHFSTTSGQLIPGGTVAINYTITVPLHTAPGGYYAVAFIETSASSASQGKTQVQVNQRLGELFYLQVLGPVAQKGRVASWQAGFLQRPPVSASLRIENDGGVHFFSDMQVTFRDVLGNPKYRFSAQKVILPHTIRRTLITWPHPPSLGLFKVGGTITIYGKTVQLTTRYVLVMSRTLRIIVASFTALLIVGLGLQLILGRKRVKRYKLRP